MHLFLRNTRVKKNRLKSKMFYTREGITGVNIILGDAYRDIKKIDDHSVDLIITDPPYDLNYCKRKNELGSITKSMSKLMEDLKDADVIGGINYIILDEFVRIMKKINIYIFCNKRQILQYLNYFVGKHQCSFEILLWIKSNPVPNFYNKYLNDKEYCLFFRKGVQMNMIYERAHTYWITPTNKKDKLLYQHPTVKPQNIIEQLVLNSSNVGDTVLDPFLGSGTTAAAAIKWKRNFIGFEKNEKYYRIAKQRCLNIEVMRK